MTTPALHFPNEVRHLLLEAGWYAGRTINTDAYAQQLTDAGYNWSEAVEEFMREFGGLHLQFLRHDGSMASLQLEPLVALQYQQPAQETFYRANLRIPTICLIGQAYMEHLILLMDQAGRVYGSFDEMLYLVGNTGADAIQAICLDLPFREL